MLGVSDKDADRLARDGYFEAISIVEISEISAIAQRLISFILLGLCLSSSDSPH